MCVDCGVKGVFQIPKTEIQIWALPLTSWGYQSLESLPLLAPWGTDLDGALDVKLPTMWSPGCTIMRYSSYKGSVAWLYPQRLLQQEALPSGALAAGSWGGVAVTDLQ